MRQLVVTVPSTRSSDVVEVLQTECEVRGVTRNEQDGVATVSCFVSPEKSGQCLHELDKIGCGAAYGTIALIPISVMKPIPKSHFAFRSIRGLFRNMSWTVSARMATEEMYQVIDGGAQLSFDYIALIIVAGWIAAIGLATNNAVMIVASMLLSPLMGPILAFTFGTMVGDWPLVINGLIVESIGIVLCLIVGLFWGFIGAAWPEVIDKYAWPTGEMLGRGEVASLVTGVLFAIPSGAGVALCATGGGSTALVGVAIAAALLPPIVNTGMNLAFAAAGAPHGVRPASEFYVIAGNSFALFGINVVCIYGTGLLVYYIKRVVHIRRQLLKYTDLPRIKVGKYASGNLASAHSVASTAATKSVDDATIDIALSPTDRFRAAAGKVITKQPSDGCDVRSVV